MSGLKSAAALIGRARASAAAGSHAISARPPSLWPSARRPARPPRGRQRPVSLRQTPGASFNSVWSTRTPAVFSMASSTPWRATSRRSRPVPAAVAQRIPRLSSRCMTSWTTCAILSCSDVAVRGAQPRPAAGRPVEVGEDAMQHRASAVRSAPAGCSGGRRPRPKRKPRSSAAARKPSGNSNGYSMASNSSRIRYCHCIASSILAGAAQFEDLARDLGHGVAAGVGAAVAADHQHRRQHGFPAGQEREIGARRAHRGDHAHHERQVAGRVLDADDARNSASRRMVGTSIGLANIGNVVQRDVDRASCAQSPRNRRTRVRG